MDSFMKVLNAPQRIIAGAVYVGGDSPDGQGDVASPAEVFKALLSHVRNRTALKVQHTGPNLAGSDIKLLANYMVGKNGGVLGGAFVPAFTWVMICKVSPEIFKDVRAGRLGGFSMSGRANARVSP